jgi:N utilization substance protein B
MSSSRSQGRRLALQILYAQEFTDPKDLRTEDVIHLAALTPPAEMSDGEKEVEKVPSWKPSRKRAIPQKVIEFAAEIIAGVRAQCATLDQRIDQALEHWKQDRIHPVERNILRIGLYELTYRPDIPAMVALHEAVDLAHRFGDDQAWRLINGILDRLGKDRIEAEGETKSK